MPLQTKRVVLVNSGVPARILFLAISVELVNVNKLLVRALFGFCGFN